MTTLGPASAACCSPSPTTSTSWGSATPSGSASHRSSRRTSRSRRSARTSSVMRRCSTSCIATSGTARQDVAPGVRTRSGGLPVVLARRGGRAEWADRVVRHFMYDTAEARRWEALAGSSDARAARHRRAGDRRGAVPPPPRRGAPRCARRRPRGECRVSPPSLAEMLPLDGMFDDPSDADAAAATVVGRPLPTLAREWRTAVDRRRTPRLPPEPARRPSDGAQPPLRDGVRRMREVIMLDPTPHGDRGEGGRRERSAGDRRAVAEVVLDRPDVLNSLDDTMVADFHTASTSERRHGACSSAARAVASPPVAICPPPSRSPRTRRRSSATSSTR